MDIKLLSQIFFNENIQPPQTCVVTGAHRRILLVSSATIRMIFRALKKTKRQNNAKGADEGAFWCRSPARRVAPPQCRCCCVLGLRVRALVSWLWQDFVDRQPSDALIGPLRVSWPGDVPGSKVTAASLAASLDVLFSFPRGVFLLFNLYISEAPVR